MKILTECKGGKNDVFWPVSQATGKPLQCATSFSALKGPGALSVFKGTYAFCTVHANVTNTQGWNANQVCCTSLGHTNDSCSTRHDSYPQGQPPQTTHTENSPFLYPPKSPGDGSHPPPPPLEGYSTATTVWNGGGGVDQDHHPPECIAGCLDSSDQLHLYLIVDPTSRPSL